MQKNFSQQVNDIIDNIELDAEIEYLEGDNEEKEYFIYDYVTSRLLEESLKVEVIEIKKGLANKACGLISSMCSKIGKDIDIDYQQIHEVDENY